jgi:hypothetical protein
MPSSVSWPGAPTADMNSPKNRQSDTGPLPMCLDQAAGAYGQHPLEDEYLSGNYLDMDFSNFVAQHVGQTCDHQRLSEQLEMPTESYVGPKSFPGISMGLQTGRLVREGDRRHRTMPPGPGMLPEITRSCVEFTYADRSYSAKCKRATFVASLDTLQNRWNWCPRRFLTVNRSVDVEARR